MLGGVIQGIQGAIAYEDAQDELAKLPGYRDYSATPQLQSYYGNLQNRSKNPYSAASTMGFQSLVNDASAGAYKRSLAINPSISGSVLAGANLSGLQQQAQRAIAGDQLATQYTGMLGEVVSMFQDINNANVQGFNQRLHTKELSLEQLKQAARQTAEEGWVAFGDQSEATTAEVFSMIYGGGGGGGSVQPTTRSAGAGGGGGTTVSNAGAAPSSGQGVQGFGMGGGQSSGGFNNASLQYGTGGGNAEWINWQPVGGWMGQ